MDETKSFEERLKRLEEIVKTLESPDTPLETALALFEEGTAIVRLLSGKLEEATQKVRLLTQTAFGGTDTEPFSTPKA